MLQREAVTEFQKAKCSEAGKRRVLEGFTSRLSCRPGRCAALFLRIPGRAFVFGQPAEGVTSARTKPVGFAAWCVGKIGGAEALLERAICAEVTDADDRTHSVPDGFF